MTNGKHSRNRYIFAIKYNEKIGMEKLLREIFGSVADLC